MAAVDKMRFQQFVKQAKGSKVFEIHVNREEKKNAILLRYNGRAPKQRTRLTGQWRIEKGEKEEGALQTEIVDFLTLARKHFFVHRGDGLKDEAFADPDQEAEATPIIKE
jgi:hypothetical protein